MKDFSIVIAHRGATLGLWATIHSCEIDLAGTGFDYEYIISANGDEKVSVDLKNITHFLDKSGRLGQIIHSAEPVSPPSARQLATKHAEGRLLFFFDDHCLVAKDYFRRAVLDFEHYGMDMLHSVTRYYTGEFDHYHYKLKLDKNFWAESAFVPLKDVRPYRLAVGGHGGFAVRRDVWEEVGGYWTGFSGYGGEEVYFDLKMAMLDKTNWIDPKVIHYHYAGSRGYPRHYSDDYYRNMMMCANIIGGESWLHRVFDNFDSKFPKQMTDKTMFDLLTEAQERSADHAAYLASVRKRTLDEQLIYFSDNNIAH